MSFRCRPTSRCLAWRSRIRAAHRGRRRATTAPRVAGALICAAAMIPALASGSTVDARSGGTLTAALDASSGPALRQQVVAEALRYRGVPYVWGGSSPAGFDCSGFTSYVYARFGTPMAHSTYAQYAAYRHVARKNLRAGDLVFFSGVGHVGIYIGHGRFVHAPRTGKNVEVQRLSVSWYRQSYVGAVRPPVHGKRTA